MEERGDFQEASYSVRIWRKPKMGKVLEMTGQPVFDRFVVFEGPLAQVFKNFQATAGFDHLVGIFSSSELIGHESGTGCGGMSA